MPKSIIDERFEKAKALFHPYFEELGIGVPEKPVIQTSRYENQVQAILDIRPPVFSFSFGVPSADILDQCRKKKYRHSRLGNYIRRSAGPRSGRR
jgi:nitronate monooxygenase